MNFVYLALDKNGKQVRDSVEAPDASEAVEIIRRSGLFVTEINAGNAVPVAGPKSTCAKISRGKRLKFLALFARQLHVLVATGIPVTQALEALERQVKGGPWRTVLSDVRSRVEQGTPLSEAMSHHPSYFDAICRSMVEAGETGGNFSAMLDRLAAMTKKQLHVRNSIVGAMVYPALLIVVAVGVLTLMLTFVLPRFAELFKSLDAPIPPATKFLMGLSEILRNYWWAVLLGIGGIVGGLRFWMGTPAGKIARDTIFIRLPQIGTIARNFATARLIRTLGVLLQSKVPLIESLRLTKLGMSNSHYAALMDVAESAVSRGDPISSAFVRADLIAPSVFEAIRNGERSGQVGPILLNMAEFMDEENEVVMKSLTSILEPMILIVLGVLVGAVALSMFMPLFDLTSMTRGGG